MDFIIFDLRTPYIKKMKGYELKCVHGLKQEVLGIIKVNHTFYTLLYQARFRTLEEYLDKLLNEVAQNQVDHKANIFNFTKKQQKIY